MRRLVIVGVGGALILFLLLGGATVLLRPASPRTASAADWAQLRIDATPLDASQAESPVRLEAAKAIAAGDTGMTGEPALIGHASVRIPGAGQKTAWLILWEGGDAGSVPHGPAPTGSTAGGVPPPDWSVDYTAVLVDDHSGEILETMRAGHQ